MNEAHITPMRVAATPPVVLIAAVGACGDATSTPPLLQAGGLEGVAVDGRTGDAEWGGATELGPLLGEEGLPAAKPAHDLHQRPRVDDAPAVGNSRGHPPCAADRRTAAWRSDGSNPVVEITLDRERTELGPWVLAVDVMSGRRIPQIAEVLRLRMEPGQRSLVQVRTRHEKEVEIDE